MVRHIGARALAAVLFIVALLAVAAAVWWAGWGYKLSPLAEGPPFHHRGSDAIPLAMLVALAMVCTGFARRQLLVGSGKAISRQIDETGSTRVWISY